MIQWLNTNAGAVQAIAAILTLILTAVLASMTGIYVYLTKIIADENRLLRKAGSDPAVVAYITPSERYINFLNLIVANVGKAPARNIRVEFGSIADEIKRRGGLLPAPNANLLSVLPQGDRLVHYIGSALDFIGDDPLPDFELTVSFDAPEGRRSQSFAVSMASFENLRRLGTDPIVEATESLKKMTNILDRKMR